MRALAMSAFCLLAVQVGCSQDLSWKAVNYMIETDFPTVSSVTTDSLAVRLSDSTAARPLLLDARSLEEFTVSHLPGAHRVDPEAQSVPALDTLSQNRSIVVYCSVGYRSARIASRLQDQGFHDVTNVKGSIFRWANEDRPVVRGDTLVRAVHPSDDTWGTLLVDSLHAYSPPDSAALSQ